VIALIDYGAGNLTSVRKALAALGAAVDTPRTPSDLAAAGGIIVPGVGHFDATSALDSDWKRAIVSGIEEGKPLLGICLGLQWLFEGSSEAPGCEGLSVMSGQCSRLSPEPAGNGGEALRLKVPHVGWNALHFPRASRLFDGIEEGAYVYFTHSYAAPVTGDAVAVTTHGVEFASGVERGRIYGVQFHPEKSGDVGLRILKNFLDVV
jgi:glutamine amidotransferase